MVGPGDGSHPGVSGRNAPAAGRQNPRVALKCRAKIKTVAHQNQSTLNSRVNPGLNPRLNPANNPAHRQEQGTPEYTFNAHSTRIPRYDGRFCLSLGLTAAFDSEAAAGIRAHGLALLRRGPRTADAFALLLAAIGFYLQLRPANQTKTYGYQRAGVLVAFVNGVTLIGLAGILFYESYRRLLRNPQ